jgi:four helix bundle protein
MEDKNYIKRARDLDVHIRLHSLAKIVIKKVIPKLPKEEKYDLADQMRRASKATTAILSEGFPKRFQQKHWDKYIIDSLGECEEMVEHLTYVRDLYHQHINSDSVQILINEYDIAIKQLHALSKSWEQYHKNKKSKK